MDLSAAASTFSGSLTVANNTIVRDSGAGGLGAAGAVVVQSGGTLEINNVSTARPLNPIAGAGVGGRGAVVGIGASAAVSGAVTLGGATTIGVETSGTLDLSGVIGGNQSVTKLLPGTLRLSGGTANTNTGTTTVAEGTLTLSKTVANGAIVGTLVVGNGLGGPGTDQVTYGNATEQIGDSIAVTVDAGGTLNLGSANEKMGAVTLNAGLAASGTITGGTLTLNGQLNAGASGAGLGASALPTSPAARIVSNVNLGGATTRRVINVPAVGLAENVLQIDGAIQAGGGQIDKQGTGTLTLANVTNSLTGVSESFPVTITQTGTAPNATPGSFTINYRGYSTVVNAPATGLTTTSCEMRSMRSPRSSRGRPRAMSRSRERRRPSR